MTEILLKIKKSLLTTFSRKQLFFVFSFIFTGLFLFFLPTNAGGWDWAVDVIGGILSGINSALGSILLLIINALIYVAGYQEFLDNPVVQTGWKMVRDLCNMFFVVVLLIIAFSSIVPVSDKYNKKLLPKMILMAVLINYSKTICGLLIDVSQVVMLTFVNAFQQAAGGNFTELLGISEIVRIADGSDAISGWSVIAAYVFGTIYLLIAIVTVVAILAMLIVRIVMIWIYVVISPAAYLLNSFPQGQSYSKKWWSEFTSNLISGPVLAFFLWLSLASLTNMSLTGGNDTEIAGRFSSSYGGSKAMNVVSLSKFAISIAMLMGGLKIASSLGGVGGSIAGKAIARINEGRVKATKKIREKTVDPMKRKGKELAKAGKDFAKDTTKAGLKMGDRGLGALVDKVSSKISGKNINNFSNQGLLTTVGMASITAPGKLKSLIKSGLRGDEESHKDSEALRNYYEDEKNKGKENARLKWTDGKEYTKNEDGNFVDDKGNILKDSKGKENIKPMTAMGAAWYDTSKETYSKSANIADSIDKKKIEEKMKELEALDLSSGDMDRRFNSTTSSATEKKALAMMMAKKGAFKDKKTLEDAEYYLQENKTLSKDFSDEVDKKQPDLHYDLKKPEGKSAFKKRLDTGKINLESINPAAFENGDVIEVMKDYFSEDEFKNVIRNLSRKKKIGNSISNGLRNKSLDNKKITDNTRDYAHLYAEITGNIGDVFSNDDKTVNIEEFERYVESASAAALSKIDANDNNEKFIESIAKKISLSKLKNLSKNYNNDSLVEKIVLKAMESDNEELKRGIYKDNDLSSKLKVTVTNKKEEKKK